MIGLLQDLALFLVALYFVRIATAHWFASRYFARHARMHPRAGYAPAVSIVKPNRGLDDETLENFRTFCEQAYPNDYEIIFCLEEATDPSVPAIRQLMAEYPERQIRLVLSDTLDSPASGKLRNLIAGIAASRYELLVLSDSDVWVEPDFLATAVQCMADPRVGLAYAVPAYSGARDLPAAMLNIVVDESILGAGSNAYFAKLTAAVGSTMVVRRAVIEEIGGLAQFSRRIVGIDISISQAVRRKGYALHLLGRPAHILHTRGSFSQWWWQLHRWLVTLRHYFPGITLAAVLFDMPLWWALLYLSSALAADRDPRAGVALVAVVALGHMLSVSLLNAWLVHDPRVWRYVWVVPLLDLLRLPLLVQSGLSDQVVWQGRRLRIHRDLTAEYV